MCAKVQDAFLEAHGMKSDHGHIALLAKAVINMHLSMLNGLRKEVGWATRAPSPVSTLWHAHIVVRRNDSGSR